MARLLGFERTDAARFSMLLSIPAILAAGSAATLDLIKSDAQHVLSDAILAGTMAFVAALVAVALMMRWLKRASFTPFVIYRVILGAVILVWAYS